jgi:exonuclease I
MSEIGEKYKGTQLDKEISRIEHGANRWQEQGKTDLLDVMNALNIYHSVLNNPTKDVGESLKQLYDKIDEANSLLLDGSDEDVLDKVEYVAKGVQKKQPTLFDPRTILEQASKLRGKDLSGNAVVLLFSNNMKMSAVLEIPF